MSIIPNVMLTGVVVSTEDYEYWVDENAPGMWDGMAYKWRVTFSINFQYHSSDQTPEPFTYDARDIKVGFWIADTGGITLKVIEIESATSDRITCIVEDVDLYNTYNDVNVSGYGGYYGNEVIVYDLDKYTGEPLLSAIPTGYIAVSEVDKIKSRHIEYNAITNAIAFDKEGHDFAVGDLVEYKGGEFIKSSDTRFTVGKINSIGIPRSSSFTIKPFGTYSNTIATPLVGNMGDVFYIDNLNPGKVTLTEPENNAYPVYIRLENEHTAFVLNSVNDAVGETYSFEVVAVDNDTDYLIGSNFRNVAYITINGLVEHDYTYNKVTGILKLTSSLGYNVDINDEMIVFVNR